MDPIEKSMVLINWSRLKTAVMLQTLQVAMKKQPCCSAVDQLMTSESVQNVTNAMNRNNKSIIWINWWRLKMFQKLYMQQIAMKKQ